MSQLLGAQSTASISVVITAIGAFAAALSSAIAAWRISIDQKSTRNALERQIKAELSLVRVEKTDDGVFVLNGSAEPIFSVAGRAEEVREDQPNTKPRADIEPALTYGVRLDPGTRLAFPNPSKLLLNAIDDDEWLWQIEFRDSSSRRWRIAQDTPIIEMAKNAVAAGST